MCASQKPTFREVPAPQTCQVNLQDLQLLLRHVESPRFCRTQTPGRPDLQLFLGDLPHWGQFSARGGGGGRRHFSKSTGRFVSFRTELTSCRHVFRSLTFDKSVRYWRGRSSCVSFTDVTVLFCSFHLYYLIGPCFVRHQNCSGEKKICQNIC